MKIVKRLSIVVLVIGLSLLVMDILVLFGLLSSIIHTDKMFLYVFVFGMLFTAIGFLLEQVCMTPKTEYDNWCKKKGITGMSIVSACCILLFVLVLSI